MNAASKGHLPVVLYLLSKQRADPLIRNNWGETAYDIAAAIFEAWICEVCIHTASSTPPLHFSRFWRNSNAKSGTTATLDTILWPFTPLSLSFYTRIKDWTPGSKHSLSQVAARDSLLAVWAGMEGDHRSNSAYPLERRWLQKEMYLRGEVMFTLPC